ncbi:hypothetical protein G7Z17_g2090 [Cylindrodendrum hubeiense]|uniref:Uncharacterized protein n=1 Tax=Cylindrodendrum hubeiense TaxID=595255 RepID=A0A9P5HDK9_9HYPO|nr:hypothetical protein G7Z17_g2090 [Cylindrodendrum hubeiense]
MAPPSETLLVDAIHGESIWEKALVSIQDEELKSYMRTAVKTQKLDILEVMARLITRFREIENQYPEQRGSGALESQAEALTHLYAEILTQLGRMVSNFKGNPFVPAAKTFGRPETMKVHNVLWSAYERRSALARVNQLKLAKLTTADCLQLILELSEQESLTIIIDGIDKIKRKDNLTVIDGLKSIVANSGNVVKVLVSNNNDHTLPPLAPNEIINVNTQNIHRDMESFVNRQLDAVLAAGWADDNVWPSMRGVLRQTLVENAGESFLLAQMQINRLVHERTEESIMFALRNNLSEELNKVYEHTLESVLEAKSTARITAITTFSLLLYMREPLTPSDFLSAVAMTSEDTLTLPQLMDMCSNLIVLDTKWNTLRLAHPSVKEYLENLDLFSAAAGQKLLAELCLEVCSRGPRPGCKMSSARDNIYAYAATYWPVHIKIAQDDQPEDAICRKVLSFVFDENPNTASSFGIWLDNIQLLVKHFPDGHVLKEAVCEIPSTKDAPLFLACVFGLDTILHHIMRGSTGVGISCKNHMGRTPIYLAAAFGHISIVSALVDHDAEIDAQGGTYGSPLQVACFAGHTHVVDKLLKYGASISTRDETGCGHVFETACHGGREEVALRLLQDKRTLQTTADYEQAILNAAQAGFLQVLQQLEQPIFHSLETLDWKEKKYQAIARKAIEGGHIDVLRRYLSATADCTKIFPEDAVAIAVLYGHKHMVEFLLENGMDIETEGKFASPLTTAAFLNHHSIVLLLLQRGAEIDANGTTGTALYIATLKAHIGIVQLLVQAGANVNQETGFHGTAMRAAAYYGHLDIVKFLFSAGAYIKPRRNIKSAFSASIEGGHPDVVALMLEKGYREFHGDNDDMCGLTARPSKYRALLRDASPGRKEYDYHGQKIEKEPALPPKPLTELDAIFRAGEGSSTLDNSPLPGTASYRRNRYSWGDENSLDTSVSLGNKDVVVVLLAKSDAMDIHDAHIKKAAQKAAQQGDSSILKVLLEYAASKTSFDSCIEPILDLVRRWALYNSNIGVDCSNVIETALSMANRYCSADEVVKLRVQAQTAVEKHNRFDSMDRTEMRIKLESVCEQGNLNLLEAMMESTHLGQLKRSDVSGGLQGATMKGRTAVVQHLLSSDALKDKIEITNDYFIGAATNGHLGIIKLFISHRQAKPFSATQIRRALVCSCRNGHSEVVRHLVEELSADVNTVVTEIPIEMETRRRRIEQSMGGLFHHGSRTRSKISPLQAAIRGFAPRPHWDDIDFDSDEINNDDVSQHEEVVKILLDNGANPNHLGAQSTYPIQAAADFCSEPAVKWLIEAGADVNATKDEGSSIFRAAGRELSGAGIMRLLLDAGADLPNDPVDVQKLQDQPLKYFVGKVSRTNFYDTVGDPDGRFLFAKPLEYVFEHGPGAIIRILMSEFPNSRASDERYGLVLQMATCINDDSYVDMLLSRGVDVNALGYYYGTALQAASRFGHEGMVTKLLERGANVNILQGRWQTALRAAIVSGNKIILHKLLHHGADIQLAFDKDTGVFQSRDTKSPTALQLAVGIGNVEIIEALLKAGADVSGDVSGVILREDKGDIVVDHHPLILSSMKGNLAMVRALLAAGAPVDVTGKWQVWVYYYSPEFASPLSAAVEAGHMDVIRLLLAHGANVDKTVNDCYSSLILAAKNGDRHIVRLLIENNANVNYCSESYTALVFAAREGHAGIVEDLMAAGAKVAKPPIIPSAFEESFKVEDSRIMELLLQATLSTDNPEPAINRAFSEVARIRNVKLMKVLLEYVPATTTRFIQACTIGSDEIVTRMLEQGMSPNQPDDQGNHPLHAAALHAQPSIIRILLDYGADIDCAEEVYGTPLTTVLLVCAAERLEYLDSELGKKLEASFAIIQAEGMRRAAWSPGEDRPPPSIKPKRLNQCEATADVLLKSGARPGTATTAFGPPLHLACLIGSKTTVQLILDKGADANETGGALTHALFVALAAHKPDIVALLLERGANVHQFHEEFGTPLHLAGKLADFESVWNLLEHGADASALDANGKLPFDVTFSQMHGRTTPKRDYKKSEEKKALVGLFSKAGKRGSLSDDLLIEAAKSGRAMDLLDAIDLGKNITVSEQTMCAVLSSNGEIAEDHLQALIGRTGGLGVTEMMLKAAKGTEMVQRLLELQPVCKVTLDVVQSRDDIGSIRVLLDQNPEIPATPSLVIHVLSIEGSGYRERHTGRRELLEELWNRNPSLIVTEDILKASQCTEDLEFLLPRFSGTISEDVIEAAAGRTTFYDTGAMIRLLLRYEPTIRLSAELVPKLLIYPKYVESLEMLLEHDKETPITEKVFLTIFGNSHMVSETTRSRLVKLLYDYDRKLVFTKAMRSAINAAYQSHSDLEKRDLFYGLRERDADE